MENEIKIIDWKFVKKRLLAGLEWLSRWYLPVVVFIVPLLIITFAWPAPVIRQLVFFILVGLGWLLWLGRALLSKETIVWQRSALGWGALAVILAALASSFMAADPAAPWGLRGVLADSSPLAWLGLAGLMMLIVQTTGVSRITEFWQFSKNSLTEIPKFRNSVLLLMSYLLSSSLLALFVIIWWIFRQELVTPALGLFSTAALWFTVNTLVLAVASLLARGRARLVCLILISLHIIVLFGYDYDLAWYALAAGGLLFSVGQLLLEKSLARVDFRLSFGLIILSVILLFVPVKSLSPKLGFDSANSSAVSTGVIWPRYYDNILKTDPLFGVGLGQSGQSFWDLAELVDMRQVRQFPVLSNGYLVILWEGGLALFGALIFLIVCLLRALVRSFSRSGVLELTAVLGFLGWSVVFALVPVDFMILFSFGLFAGLLGAALPGKRAPLASRQGIRSFLLFGGALLAVFLALTVIVSFKDGRLRLDFLNSIKTDKTGTSIDLLKLDRAIARSSRVYAYRLARIDFTTQALREALANKPDVKPEELERYLASLQADYKALEGARLDGRQQWILAWDAEQIGAISRSISRPGEQAEDKGKEWFVRARALYESCLALLARNVIIFTDVARFYRMYGADILKSGETADTFYRQAHSLLDRALAIDNTFEQSFVEQAELLSTEGKSEEAFASLKPLADQNPAASYSVGHLAFAAKKFDEAVKYLKKAIELNPNHLQARYELVQAYLALADKKSAEAELYSLEEKAPKDDAATQTLLKGLKELLK